MIRSFLFILSVFFIFDVGYSQSSQLLLAKPPIDTSVFGKWPHPHIEKISDDGKYVVCDVNNEPLGGNTVILKSTFNKWSFDLIGAHFVNISGDGRKATFIKNKDSLGILDLGTDKLRFIINVSEYKISNNKCWIAYQIKDSSKQLSILNLISGKEVRFQAVKDFQFDDLSSAIILNSLNQEQEDSLKWFDLNEASMKTIWTGYNPRSFIFNKHGDKMAFISDNATVNGSKSIWLYSMVSQKAIRILSDDSLSTTNEFILSSLVKFSSSDSAIIFNLAKKNSQQASKGTSVQVEVWSYSDDKLQSQKKKETLSNKNYATVVTIQDRKIFRIQQEDEVIDWHMHAFNDDHVLLTRYKGDYDLEWNWNPQASITIYLVNIKSGERKVIAEKLHPEIARSYWISPLGKYIIYYNALRKAYFSYIIGSGKVVNLTKGLNSIWTVADTQLSDSAYRPIGYGGWINEEKGLLLYDQTDIFLADPEGKRPIINLTHGNGKKNNIVFRVAMDYYGKFISTSDTIILSAFDLENKWEGFYSVHPVSQNSLTKLTMQPYIFRGYDASHEVDNSILLKAKDANVYVTRRMSASKFPNFYFTSDFVSFNPITEFRPEKNFNWLTTELIKWRTPDGKMCDGILYKPENFDSTITYPLIFHYYEKMSDGLNAFIFPGACTGPINIAYFVSNGYLVFTPDIHYQIGHPGKSVVNAIVSATKYLCKRSYIDSKRIGIQGHSRGGWETNYLVTHTNIFAAAMSSSGMSDYVSLYLLNREYSSGKVRTGRFEHGPQRIGTTLWQLPELYIENSPIFNADKVTTPLLMMSNRMDSDVPFNQGLEFFIALRRLQKKVWMLQYDEGGHLVLGQSAIDLTIRMKEFFDHFLKGYPSPNWMVKEKVSN